MAPPERPLPFLKIKFENEEPEPPYSTTKMLDNPFASKVAWEVEVNVMFLYTMIWDSALSVVNSPFRISVSPSLKL